MNAIVINLSEPFEKVLAKALSLARDEDAQTSDAAIKQAARYLYEAANGRIVETSVGPIPIAPPVDPSLKERPVHLKSATELVTLLQHNLGAPDCADQSRPDRQRPHYSSLDSALLESWAAALGAPECPSDQRHVGASCSGPWRHGATCDQPTGKLGRKDPILTRIE